MRVLSQPSRASTTITVVAAALLCMGIVMVFSATATLGDEPLFADPLRNPAIRQASFTLIAMLGLLIGGAIPYTFWRVRPGSWWQPAILLLLIAIGFCAMVLVPGIGTLRNGARRWLSIGPSSWGLGFQPSELAKVAIVVFTAAYAAHCGERIRKFWRGLLPGLLLVGLVVALVGKEDFGTAALLGAVGVGVLMAAGARIWQLVLCAAPGVAGMVYLIVAEPYRMERLLAFRDIWADPRGRGYHQVQSLLTIASGDLWGVGLGAGIQKYGYLPEARSDFIFAVVCEELGLVGGAALIALFIVLIWQARRAMLEAVDDLGRLLVVGVAATIGLQAALNIAVVTVSVPTKGISLPLVSAGGSGVVFLATMIGILANVARRRGREWLPDDD